LSILQKALELIRNETTSVIYISLLVGFIVLVFRSIIQNRGNPLSRQVSSRIEAILDERGASEKGREYLESIYHKILEKTDDRIKRSNLNFTPQEFLMFNLIGIGVGAVIGLGLFPFKSFTIPMMFFISEPGMKIIVARLFTALALSVAGYFLPIMIAYYRERKRVKDLEEQLVPFILSMADALSTAKTPRESIEMIADEITDPLGSDLKRARDEINAEIPYGDVLENLSRRIDLEEYKIILTSMIIQSRTGSNLEPMLRNSARIAEDRKKTKDEVMQVVNGTSYIAYIILASPIAAIIGMTFILGDEFIDNFFTLMGAIYFGGLSVFYVIGAIGVLMIRNSIIKLL